MFSVDQVFLQMRAGHLELLLVKENLAGARQRETLRYPTQNTIDAVRRAAKQLAYRGDIDCVKNTRFRREQKGKLKDDPELKRLFISEFEYHKGDDEWD